MVGNNPESGTPFPCDVDVVMDNIASGCTANCDPIGRAGIEVLILQNQAMGLPLKETGRRKLELIVTCGGPSRGGLWGLGRKICNLAVTHNLKVDETEE